jgi:hypothetical protein
MAFKNVLRKAAVSVALLTMLAGNTSSVTQKFSINKEYTIHRAKEEVSKPDIRKVYLVSRVNEEPYSISPKHARLEDKVRLGLVVEAMVDGKKVYFSESNEVIIDDKKEEAKPWVYGDVTITWYKVESEKSSYNNWWEGWFEFETPAYKETKVSEKGWSIIADAKPTEELKDVNESLGIIRYKVEFYYNGKKVSTPGKESTDYQGITNDVHRISFRKDDSFTGWMTSFFNTPYVYGSTEYQAENYIGLDCADFVIAAYRKTGHDIPYTHVTGLYKYSNIIAQEKDVKINGDDFYYKGKPLFFGKDVKEGDLLIFADSHVGVLYKDKSDPNGKFRGEADGILNKYDLMIHIYFDNPKYESLDYCTSFSVLRLK